MRDDTPLSALTGNLKSRGFEYYGRSADNWLEFKGSVSANGAQHPALLSVDPNGMELPRVVVTIPPSAPQVLAHVGANGQVCYAAKGSLVLDVFDISGQTLACIDRATHVLDLSLRGLMKQDLEDEFFAFWPGKSLCVLDIYAGGTGTLDVLFAGHDDVDRQLAFVTNDAPKTRLKLKALRLPLKEELTGAAFKVRSAAKPRPTQGEWPPRTVAALLQWQGLLDPATRRNIERHLLVAGASGRAAALCVVESPLMQYAFWVAFPEQKFVADKNRGDAIRRRLYASEVHPMMTVRMDDRHVSQRNTPGHPTLAGKRIALIGCGTIGGFLAELLVKAGAGLDKGELLLVDPDILMPQNVGRHRLGLNHALTKKATALKQELLAGAPTSNLRDLPVSVEEVDLSRIDLIINATGEEALGHLLARKAGNDRPFIPTLTAWVEGPGVAVRALLQDQAVTACVRCMTDRRRNPLYPVVEGEMPVELAGHGCESLYVPFPATVSVHAACLAAEMVTDWASGNPSPRLRTRITRAGFIQASPDSDIARVEDCPACST